MEKGTKKGVVWVFFPKKRLCPVRNRLWSMSLRGVGGLALHGKAAGVPPPPPRVLGVRGKREVRNLSNTPPGSADPKP